ncbi:DUF4249 domain-containing protein [Runella sp.]|uniref:DUF4249 domain-containing protein n=1 Tax=Runella sp. TaxID=1960881 RepID=UPI003D0CD1B3
MKNLSIILFIIISISLFSCETLVNDVDPDRLPRSDNKLVVHGYLSPQDTVILISVYYSSQLVGGTVNYYMGGSGPAVSFNDAVVTLSNQGKSITIPFDYKSGSYSIKATEMPIIVGQTYDLKVIRNGETVESSCTVPKAVTIQEIKQDSVDSRSIFSSSPNFIPPKDYLYRIVWKDITGEPNYYRVGGYAYQVERIPASTDRFEERPNIVQLSFRENNRFGDLLSDERNDGIQFVSNNGILPGYFSYNRNIIYSTRRVELFLLSCEKTYYDYHRAVRSFDDDNPFAEPSLIPSNIKNGLGCFAAYNRSVVVLK